MPRGSRRYPRLWLVEADNVTAVTETVTTIGSSSDVSLLHDRPGDPGSDRFRVAFENAPIGVALVSTDGRWLHVNAALCELLGYGEDELLQLSIVDVTHPADRSATIARRKQQLRGRDADKRIEKRYVRSDGQTIWVAVTSTVVRDDHQLPLYTVAQIEDIGERVRTQRALAEAEERFRRAFDDAPIGMALVGCDGRFLQTNRTLSAITGYTEHELLRRTFADITHPDDLDADVEQARRLLAGETEAYQMEKRYVCADGSVVWVALSVSLVRDAGGKPMYFVAQIEDINARKLAEQELRFLADHDPLTGLLNRRRFYEEVDRELGRLGRHPHRHAAVLLLDVDRFKTINDALGHKAGDEVLTALAGILGVRLRASDSVGRLGGDEVAALLVDITEHDDAVAIARELRDTIRAEPILTSAGPVAVTVSIGVAALGADSDPVTDHALTLADDAMYQAKRNGRDQIGIAA